jgi:hypothetical protein
MDTFYVSHNGDQLGPWSQPEITKRLKARELSWNDYVFDSAKNDWVFIMDHPQFTEAYKVASAKPEPPKPKAPPKQEVAEAKASKSNDSGLSAPKQDKEWFVLKSENRYGPFSHLEIVRMLQEKNIFEFDYVWNQAMANWKRVAEVEEFGPEKIKALQESGRGEVQEVFFRRRHARAHYGASIIVHNNKKVWKGESVELSSGGAGLVIDNHEFQPGQTLFLHFKPGDGVPPFNAICTIVSKQVPAAGSKTLRYGVKFTSINRNIQESIKDYTDKAA